MRQTGASFSRVLPYLYLALAALFWSGNWIVGRAVRDAMTPVTINFWRWLIAALILAPFAMPGLAGKWPVIRRHWRILLLLALVGVAMFQSFVYLGLETTTAINAILINSSLPLFMILCSWLIEGERVTTRQIGGMMISLIGILVIMRRGTIANFFSFEFHTGDAWILAAMPLWGLYSVLLKRKPAELGSIPFLFVIAVMAIGLMLPFHLIEIIFIRPPVITAGVAASIVYIALFASIAAFICWNKAVAAVGANVAGFSIHLMPVFGTVLAILLLGEDFHLFHLFGMATILAGVLMATIPRRVQPGPV
ncbi:MAG: DMT family transporter [Rhodospirillales bacterium]|nr:DMT family transporter [Rhodospirillales bacterium]